jgi:hypothetical protein
MDDGISRSPFGCHIAVSNMAPGFNVNGLEVEEGECEQCVYHASHCCTPLYRLPLLHSRSIDCCPVDHRSVHHHPVFVVRSFIVFVVRGHSGLFVVCCLESIIVQSIIVQSVVVQWIVVQLIVIQFFVIQSFNVVQSIIV